MDFYTACIHAIPGQAPASLIERVRLQMMTRACAAPLPVKLQALVAQR